MLFGAIIVGAVAFFVRRWQRSGPPADDGPSTAQDADLAPPEPIVGLSEEEAGRRRVADPADEREDRDREVQRAVIRRTVFSIFNLTLIGLSISMWLLDDPWGAILAILLLIFNIVMKIAQQMLAKKQIDQVADQARPIVAVIRDGETRRIDLADLVEGDVIAIGPGDELVADGELLSRSPISVSRSSDADAAVRRCGDQLHAGEQCVRGWGDYRAAALDPALTSNFAFGATPAGVLRLTPIQRLMDGILRVLLGTVVLFLVLLILKMANVPLMTPQLQEQYREIASIIFSLAPSGLYFTALVTYAMGAALLARNGALVRDTGLVEALAQTTVICFGKSGVLTKTQVSVEIIKERDTGSALPPNRIVQLLGVFAHSLSSQSSLTQMIGDAYDGQSYHPASELPIGAVQGVQAISLDEPEVRGVYVLADEAKLAEYVQPPVDGAVETVEAEDAEAGPSTSIWSRTKSRMTSLFRRDKGEAHADAESADEVDRAGGAKQAAPAASSEKRQDISDDEGKPSHSFAGRMRRSRLWHSVGKGIHRMTGRTEPEEPETDPEPQEVSPSRVVFAYSPDPSQLSVEDGLPIMSCSLVPLCYLDITEDMRQGAQQVVDAFAASGVDVKVLSADAADEVDEVIGQLGALDPGDAGAATLTGSELRTMPEHERAHAVSGAPVIAGLDVGQRSEVIRLLRLNGESVAMVGDSLNDVGAMDEASISVALQTSSQAAIRSADIILLGDTLDSLATVLQIGQRVVNGLLNTLKLNLTQITYVLLLLIAMVLTGRDFFYYQPSQGGLVIFFTVIAPSMGLTLWATTGAVDRATVFRRLARFVVPAAITITVAVLLVDGLVYPVAGYEYARLSVTWYLLMAGSLLVLFVQPAIRLFAGTGTPTGDWRPAWLTAGLFALSVLLAMLPRAEQWFAFTLLDSLQNYLFLAAIALVWMIVVQLIWRLTSLFSRVEFQPGQPRRG